MLDVCLMGMATPALITKERHDTLGARRTITAATGLICPVIIMALQLIVSL